MLSAFYFNIALVLAVTLVTFFLVAGSRRMDGVEKAFAVVWATWVTICLSGTAWLVYVIVHFAAKYW